MCFVIAQIDKLEEGARSKTAAIERIRNRMPADGSFDPFTKNQFVEIPIADLTALLAK